MLPAFETISLPGLMNISFFMGTQIEIFALPYHRYDTNGFPLTGISFFLQKHDGRNNDFSIFIDFY
jgi:hypothetical protein